MTRPRSHRSTRILLLAAAVAGSVVTGLAVSPAAQAQPAAATDLYIVQVVGAPVAAYSGTVAGFPATKPADGTRLHSHAAGAQRYQKFLLARQRATLANASVSPSSVVYDYSTTFNGMAVELTAAQAQKLRTSPTVVNVFKNQILTVQTPPTPKFLGLTGPKGVWNKQFGGDKKAGAGVIVGVIDTGFWPESPSFAAIAPSTKDDQIIAAKWHGTCDAGTEAPVTCNNKVIGARWFNATGLATANPGEFSSPRDFDGHGSHTASTAAGNYVANAMVNGTSVGDLEGVAPAARLAAYKVLYENASGTTASGSSVDIVAAVEQAVTDGVDVINYSIGDNVDSFGPEEQAFLGAAQAGVFVSAAAGNAGPGASTVDNAMPWETTVAAGTFDQQFTASVTLGNGATYTGVGRGAAVPSAPLIDSVNAVIAGATVANAELCMIGTLDPAKVTGKIVLCKRGVNARTDKSQAVRDAGGVGVILYNPSANSLNADFHFVPTVHVDEVAGAAIKAYLAATAAPTATLGAGTVITARAPAVAAFSSRGPSNSSGGGLLKPDIMAPGVDVVAAVSPAHHAGNLYDAESGTSMAAPHIAGVAALILSKHPTWSPMWVKSAMMTGATVKDNQRQPIQGLAGDATPFEMGAGEVVPAESFDPGLVYDSTYTQWLQYTCGIGNHLGLPDGSDVCDTVGSIQPSDLNYPTIAVGDLAGKRTVARTVTNTSPFWAAYQASVSTPAGFSTKVTPSILLIRPGGTATFKVAFTRTTAALGAYAFGSLTWSDLLGHKVRSTIAVKPVPTAVPGSVTGAGASGSLTVTPRAGFVGTLTASGHGLVPATVHTSTLVTDVAGFNPAAPAAGPGTARVDFTVPAGSELARFQTLASDYAAGTDTDLFVYARGAGGQLGLAGQSAGGTADELVDLPGPGEYTAFIDLFANPAGPASALPVTGYQSTVRSQNEGNFTVSPATTAVTIGQAVPLTVGWSGLDPAQHYLGVIDYGDGTSQIGQTVVRIN